MLAGERGSRCLVKPLPGVQMPATVQAVLAARINRLVLEAVRRLAQLDAGSPETKHLNVRLVPAGNRVAAALARAIEHVEAAR